MPILDEGYKDRWHKINSKPQSLGYCWGSDVIYIRYPVKHENDTTAVFLHEWRGRTFVTVETDYFDESQVRGVWLDIDGDGKAERFFDTVDEFEEEFGIKDNDDGLCPVVKHVLDYWRN